MAQRESRLSRNIMNAINLRGGFAFKIHGGPWMMAGLPDIIACVDGKFFGLETKMPDGGKTSAVQELVHRKIRAAEGVAVVVRSVSEALEVCGLS